MSKFLGVVVAAAAAAGEAAAGVAQVLHLAGCRVDTKHVIYSLFTQGGV